MSLLTDSIFIKALKGSAAISKAAKNLTAVTINTSWSVTDLSVKTTTNGKKNTTSTAFALYKIAEAAGA